MAHELGPFSVSAAQVVGLGDAFSTMVNELLAAEHAICAFEGSSLVLTENENTPDGGVDARIQRAGLSAWIPEGDSVWQFKRAAASGQAWLKAELRKSTRVHEALKAGAAYRVVIGSDLNDKQIAKLEGALREVAKELDLPHEGETIRVLGAVALAKWFQSIPALAVASPLQGMGHHAMTYQTWASGLRRKSEWVPTGHQKSQVEAIRTSILENDDNSHIRLTGESGLGKTRTVLEALADARFASLVAYVPDEGRLDASYLHNLLLAGRTVILVLDECDARRHEIIEDSIPADASLTVISLGIRTERPFRVRPLSALRAQDDELEAILQANEPLFPEARRWVINYADGVPGFALTLASWVKADDGITAGSAFTRELFVDLVRSSVPDADVGYAP